MSDGALVFRDARDTDLDFVLAGLTENRTIEGRSAESARATERDRRAYAEAIADGAIRILEEGAAAIGFLSFRVDFDVMYVEPRFLWVDLVFVAAAERGRGLGRRLYDEASRLAKARGCTRVVADVFEQNRSSATFHRRMGFVPKYTIYVRAVDDPAP